MTSQFKTVIIPLGTTTTKRTCGDCYFYSGAVCALFDVELGSSGGCPDAATRCERCADPTYVHRCRRCTDRAVPPNLPPTLVLKDGNPQRLALKLRCTDKLCHRCTFCNDRDGHHYCAVFNESLMIDHPTGTDFLRLEACLNSDTAHKHEPQTQGLWCERFVALADIYSALTTRHNQRFWLVQHRSATVVKCKEISPSQWKLTIPIHSASSELPLIRICPNDLLVVDAQECRDGPVVQIFHPMVAYRVDLTEGKEVQYGYDFPRQYLTVWARGLPGDLVTTDGVISQVDKESV